MAHLRFLADKVLTSSLLTLLMLYLIERMFLEVSVLKVFDLFCGVGGFSTGFEQTGQFRVIAGLDALSSSLATFRANHPGAIVLHKDITKFRPQEAANAIGYAPYEIDVMVGGPPCQGFSSVRPFRSNSEDDPRNHLFNHFGFYVRYFRPKFFVIENVVGMVSHKNGKAVKSLITFFKGLGYTVNWAVLNAVHYGLPQRRERVFFLGYQGKHNLDFPAPTYYFNGRSMAGNGIPRILPMPLLHGCLPPALTIEDAINDLPPLQAGEKAGEYRQDIEPTAYQAARRGNSTSVSLHESTAHTPRMLEIIRNSGSNRAALPKGMTSSGYSTSYSRLDANEPAVTLTVNFVHPASNKCIHPTQDRALTPREGARLQGFDDNFNFVGSRTQIVKQLGNAVPPLLGKAIAEQLLKYA